MEKEQLEKLTRDYQSIQEQLQALSMQKEQYKGQSEELKRALEEVSNASGRIFLAVGGIMAETDKQTAEKSLKERQESSAMRLSIIERQLTEASKREQSLRSEITAELKGAKDNE